jgi:hypothetical protein
VDVWDVHDCSTIPSRGAVRKRPEESERNVQRGNPFWVVSVAPNVLHQHSPYFLAFARHLVLGSLD